MPATLSVSPTAEEVGRVRVKRVPLLASEPVLTVIVAFTVTAVHVIPPPPVPFAAAVILPFESTVILALV